MAEGDNLEKRIDEILYGKWFVETQSQDPARRLLVMRYPTLAENRLCDYHRTKFVEENKSEIMSIKEAQGKACANRTWLPVEDERIAKLQEGIESLKESREEYAEKAKKNAMFKGKVRTVDRELDRCSRALSRLLTKKYEIFGNTLEYIAEQRRLNLLVGLVTEDLDGNPVWSSPEKFNQETDNDLIDVLVDAYVRNERTSIDQIREIARNNIWRYRWTLGKTNIATLFGREIRDMTPPQSLLVFWSEVYDSAFESIEPPPRHVIDDDEMFDKWLDSRAKEAEKKQTASYYKMKSDFKGNEKFVMVDGYYDDEGIWRPHTKEEKDRIADAAYGQNSILIRKMQKSGSKRLMESGGEGTPEQSLRRGYHKVLGWDKIHEQGAKR